MKSINHKILALYARRTIRLIWTAGLVTVVVGSLLPHAGPPDAGFGLDKVLHALGYAILTALAMWIFKNRKTAIFTALAMAPTGLMLEIIQMYVPGRTFSADDLMANNIGVLAGLGMGLFWRLKRHYSRKCDAGPSF